MIAAAKRFLWGTFGQTVLLVSVALLVAQGFGFALIVNERERWRLLDATQPAIEQFVAMAGDVARQPQAGEPNAMFGFGRPDRHFFITSQSVIAMFGLERESDLEARLKKALAAAGVRVRTVRASSAGFSNSPPGNNPSPPPFIAMFARPPGAPGVVSAKPGAMGYALQPIGPPPGEPVSSAKPDFAYALTPGPMGVVPPQPGEVGGFAMTARGPGFPSLDEDERRQEIDLSAQLSDGRWLNGRFLSLSPSTSFLSRLVLAEVILFALVLTATLMLAMRLARPMQELAGAAERIGADRFPSPIAERGPPDIRAAIRSFNAMTRRVADLLREKDGMLGAIGHDLRTPLASLRIRAESVEPEAERRKIIETLDDMSQMVDEILDFARLGHSSEAFVSVDIAALADAVVEEFREMGKNASFVESARTVLRVQPMQTKRLLRNLLENATKFGDRARVSVGSSEKAICVSVADDGPGIGPEALERVFEPFYRVETSRSRATGGAGLGLSIAQGIARNQGAELVLENSSGKGLVARVTWPKP